ncbi:MAG: acyl-CoA thioesterase II [Proteobacteria bacterium]|nr:acyl-CoA thioesterase II [Pseudomonadota bacterium]
MTELVDELLDMLDLEEIDRNIYRGRNERGRPGRLFGGQVAAQALVAAGRTVEERGTHSLHAYFLRPGDPGRPVLYSVDRIRDGRSFTTRRVVAQQHGKAIFNMAVSFQTAEESYEHQVEMPEAPDPDSLPDWNERAKQMADRIPEESRAWVPRPRPIDMRFTILPTYFGGEPSAGQNLVWFRVVKPLPDDGFLHQTLLTYASDMSLLDNVVRPHGRKGPLGPMMMASLDHAVWFHKPLRVDDWLLYVQDSPVAAGARGFARGTIFTRDGELVASVAQEGLMRPAQRPEDRSQ